MRTGPVVGLVVVASLLGCRPVEPAPEDVDGLLHELWASWEDPDPERLSAIVANLEAALGPLEEPADGEVSDLSREEIAAATDRDVDPAAASGVWIATGFPCTPRALEAIVTYPDQDRLYDIFDSYERTFSSGRAAFLDARSDALDWEVVYGATVPIGVGYTAVLDAGARRIDSEAGWLLLTRSVLREPATFDNEDAVFDQDWRIELYWAPEPGRVVHVEGLWRHMDAGAVDTDNETVRRLILNSLADWDATTASWCAEGLP